jgi:hypothetical protein
LSAAGGSSTASDDGGAGTVYQNTAATNVSYLLVDGGGSATPSTQEISDGVYTDVTDVSGVTWINFGEGETDQLYDVIDVRGNAHLAFMSTATTPPLSLTLAARFLNGDRTGVVHVGYNQTFSVLYVDANTPVSTVGYPHVSSLYVDNGLPVAAFGYPASRALSDDYDLPLNMYVYPEATLALESLSVRMTSVFVDVRGIMGGAVTHVAVASAGSWTLSSEGRSSDYGTNASTYTFESVSIQSGGLITVDTLVDEPDVHLVVGDALTVKANGELNANALFVSASSVLVARGGLVTSETRGDAAASGMSPGLSANVLGGTAGGTGAGHGGRGGRAALREFSVAAYGDFTMPVHFGSGGGNGGAGLLGGAGGGRFDGT